MFSSIQNLVFSTKFSSELNKSLHDDIFVSNFPHILQQKVIFLNNYNKKIYLFKPFRKECLLT